jgi:hypothetical protein
VNFNQFISEDFKLFWYAPVRAYPGLKLRHQFIAYEAFNQPLLWQLIGPPTGMRIDPNSGLLEWTPSLAGIYKDIVVRVSRPDGQYLERKFTVSVNTDDFIFVDSARGADSNAGGSSTPLRTISAALLKAGTAAKTVYVRSGVYKEYSDDNNPKRLRISGAYAEGNPFILSSYPGDEKFVLDCDYKGWGFAASGEYVVLQDLVVEHAFASYAGQSNPGAIVVNGRNTVVQNAVARNSSWWVGQNMTGILVQSQGNVLLDRVRAHDNSPYDKNNTSVSSPLGGGFFGDRNHLYNASNFLFYTDGPVGNGVVHVLNSYSSGSIIGYKIKHSGPAARVIVHNSVSDGDYVGFGGSSDFSSVRYSLFLNSKVNGVSLSHTDIVSGANPDPAREYGRNTMLIEHNTIKNTGGGFGINIGPYYANNAIIIKNLIDQSGQTQLGLADYPGLFVALYVEGSKSILAGSSPVFSKNHYYASSNAQIAFKTAPYVNISVAQWASYKGLSSPYFDADNSRNFAQPHYAADGLTQTTSSPALFSASEFAGAR